MAKVVTINYQKKFEKQRIQPANNTLVWLTAKSKKEMPDELARRIVRMQRAMQRPAEDVETETRVQDLKHGKMEGDTLVPVYERDPRTGALLLKNGEPIAVPGAVQIADPEAYSRAKRVMQDEIVTIVMPLFTNAETKSLRSWFPDMNNAQLGALADLEAEEVEESEEEQEAE